MQNEIWKDIRGYVGLYQVSNLGRVRSLDRYIEVNSRKPYTRHKRGQILKPTPDKDGYLIVGLCKKKCRVSRITATEFINNPNNYEQVNHKNGDKEDNSVENLEWCSNKYNQEHAYAIGLKKTLKFARIDKQSSKVINIYDSLKEAVSDNLNSDASTIVKVCRGKRNEHCGYRWVYATEDMKVGDVVDRVGNSS